MKKILIIHSDAHEGNKIREILAAGGYDALVVDSAKDCPDSNMLLICRNSARVRAAVKDTATNGEASGIFTLGGLSIDFPSRTVIADGRKVHLTPIEFRIVSLLAKNQNTVLLHEQIINEIWGPFNSDNLVLRVNIANIRRKIEQDPGNPKYIRTATGVGYFMGVF